MKRPARQFGPRQGPVSDVRKRIRSRQTDKALRKADLRLQRLDLDDPRIIEEIHGIVKGIQRRKKRNLE